MNSILADLFSEIAQYYKISDDTQDKIRRAPAYEKASKGIENYREPIFSGKQARLDIDGVGPSMESDIDEFLTTGEISRLEKLKKDYEGIIDIAVVRHFKEIYGIGDVKAVEFYKKGYRTFGDLWKKARLNDKQKIGMLWRKHLQYKISREEMDYIREFLQPLLKEYEWTMVGSYRRGKPVSSDVDILVVSNDLPEILEKFGSLLVADLSSGPNKYMGIIRLGKDFIAHRIDIKCTSEKSFYYSLLFFTGSRQLNITMRNVAISMGLTLNEYGLYGPRGKSFPADSEEQIFAHLRMEFLPPAERG